MLHLLVLLPFGRAGGSYLLPSFVLVPVREGGLFLASNLLLNRSLASKVSFCREAPIFVKAVASIELSFSPAREIRFKGILNRGLDSIILCSVIEAHLSLIGMRVKYPHLAFQTFLAQAILRAPFKP